MMTRMLTVLLISLMTFSATAHEDVVAEPKPEKEARPQIEVVFVLDTTGSMSGLIEGAKAKIWSIANQMLSAKPTPDLKIGLIGYRDRGDEYVTVKHDLTADIDAVHTNLMKFKADGGGDRPESVNQALHEATHDMTWSESRDVLKIVFLVGDAPPHMDFKDDVKYQKTCEAAVNKDLIINTVQCGNGKDTTPVWRDIASLSEGKFVQIGQSGRMQVVSTPFDKKLAKLNAEMGGTVVAYGDESRRRKTAGKLGAAFGVSEAEAGSADGGERFVDGAEAANKEDAAKSADRLELLKKEADKRAADEPTPASAPSMSAVTGGGDLVDDYARGRVDLEDVKDEELPEHIRKMSKDEREAYLKEQVEKRKVIEKQIAELLDERAAWLAEDAKKKAVEGKGDAFDDKVFDMIKEQAKEKKIAY